MRVSPIFFLLFTSTTLLSATTSTTYNRRILHQPFFPDDSFPPSQSPFPVPLTDSPPDPQPFFPSIPSPPPPPPPPSAPASFPANISSLNLPSSAKSKPVSSKLIVTAVVVVIAAVLVVALVVGLRVRKRKQMREGFSDGKTYRSDNSSGLFGSSTNNGNGGAGGGSGHSNAIPRLQRPSQTSSEFLYLGTLVNSQGGGIDARPAVISGGDVSLRKVDSPELRPLPPLGGGGHSVKHGYEMADLESSREDEFEEFYSPRVSLGGRDSSIGTGSGRTFAAATAENFESRRIIGSGSGSSSSYSSSSGSGSNSPARRSVSLSISPPVSLSPIRSQPKSPELVAIVQTSAPSRPAPPPPPIFSTDLGKSQETSPRISNFSEKIPTTRSNIRNFSPATLPVPPPPPPPPPPAGHWKTPSPRTPAVRAPPLLKPPVLITPSRPVPILNPPVISPMEFPAVEKNEETPKPKLKPLHWDKVRASSDREMVWDQLKSSSFKLNEEMIETLFVVKTPTSNPKETTNYGRPILPSLNQENRVLDPKKSQNIAISLRALNATIEEVCEALLEGNADALGTELLESLLKMAPTKEEERKLKEYRDDSPFKLGPAEKFLKALLDIPFAFKRVDAMLYVSNFDSEIEYLKRSFETLEAACEELRNNRMFLKLLEAVLKTGNRMNVGTNRGDAHAFKLDTLLKLVDVKGADGKTTLLHFVVQEITKSEGARLSNNNKTPSDDAKCRKLGLQVVSGLCSDLANVKKAAAMDSEVLNGDVLKLSKGISNIIEVVRLNEMTGMEENKRKFSESMNKFMKIAEEEIITIQAQESVALSLVKEITEYFHGNSSREEAHPFRIFMVVRDFLKVLDRVCKEVGIVNERKTVSPAHKFPVPVNPILPPVFTGFSGRRQYSSSDDDSASPS